MVYYPSYLCRNIRMPFNVHNLCHNIELEYTEHFYCQDENIFILDLHAISVMNRYGIMRNKVRTSGSYFDFKRQLSKTISKL